MITAAYTLSKNSTAWRTPVHPGQLILISQGPLAHERLISTRAQCLSARGEPAQGTMRAGYQCLTLTSTKIEQQSSEAHGLRAREMALGVGSMDSWSGGRLFTLEPPDSAF